MSHFILHPIRLQELARQWILEDTSSFDFAGSAIEEKTHQFVIYKKSQGVLAGIPFADAVFEELGLSAEWLVREGTDSQHAKEVAIVSGSARKLLIAERIVLNIICRASGIATLTSKMKATLEKVQWKGTLAATRKTTPGFRMVEKYAVLVGGGDMHRYDLSDMVMLKDNHISLSESITKAVKSTRKQCGFTHKIEVECNSLGQALEACEAGCNIVMLDNFLPEDLESVAEKIKIQYPNVLIEVSGGITEENINKYCTNFVDIISSSRMVQGYPAVDFSMKTFKK